MIKLMSLVGVLFCMSCTPKIEKINFGKDNCSFCSMTIMDAKFGAELITKKGKVFKFDSGECLINFLQENREQNVEQIYVINYQSPGVLIDVQHAFFVQGGEIQSPMGGRLAAFYLQEGAQAYMKEKHASIFNWNTIKQMKF